MRIFLYFSRLKFWIQGLWSPIYVSLFFPGFFFLFSNFQTVWEPWEGILQPTHCIKLVHTVSDVHQLSPLYWLQQLFIHSYALHMLIFIQPLLFSSMITLNIHISLYEKAYLQAKMLIIQKLKCRVMTKVICLLSDKSLTNDRERKQQSITVT